MFRLVLAALVIALVVWAVRAWKKAQPIERKVEELHDVEVEEDVLHIDEQIDEKRKDIADRRAKLGSGRTLH